MKRDSHNPPTSEADTLMLSPETQLEQRRAIGDQLWQLRGVLVLAVTGIVQAAPSKASDDLYIYGTPNGCLVQLKTPLKANEYVQWNGDCSNGFASGNGVLLVLDNSGKTNSALRMTMKNGVQSSTVVPVSNPSAYQRDESGYKQTAQPAAASKKRSQSGGTASNCPTTFSGDQTYAGPWIWRRTDGTTATLINPHGNEYTSSSLQDLASGKVDMGAGHNQKTQLQEWARCHLGQ